MRRVLFVAAFSACTFAQLPAPNAAGVEFGHIHLRVHDGKAQFKVWQDVFAPEMKKKGPMQVLQVPGIYIIISAGETNGASEGSAINHIGFAVKDLAAAKAKLKSDKIPFKEGKSKDHVPQIFAIFPEGIGIEITEDKNLATPVAFTHVHLAAVDPEAETAWYVKHFGAMATVRHDLPAAVIPSGEIDVLKTQMPQAPTKNRPLDHMSFEVKNLEEFCKGLQADGVKFNFEYHDIEQLHLKVAFLTDPAGAFIELTEGITPE